MINAIWAAQEKCIAKPTAVPVSGETQWTVSGGPIAVVAIGMICTSANNANATTVRFRADGTDGAATDFSAASASLANAAAGAIVVAVPGTTATATALYANGVGVGPTVGMIVPAGEIKIVTAVGPFTGSWSRFIRYIPLTPDSLVS